MVNLLTLFIKQRSMSLWKEREEDRPWRAPGTGSCEKLVRTSDIEHVTRNARAFTMTLSRVITSRGLDLHVLYCNYYGSSVRSCLCLYEFTNHARENPNPRQARQ